MAQIIRLTFLTHPVYHPNGKSP